jgi:predicted ATP-grasp superfamily ATP-dependent carboligase
VTGVVAVLNHTSSQATLADSLSRVASAHGLRLDLTNRVESLRAFLASGRTVVKPVSGVRATTRELTTESVERLARTQGPVLAQRLIEGYDVRVHVVNRQVQACAFFSPMIDYQSDHDAEREVIDIPDELAQQLMEKTAEQGLVFPGWDFKVHADGTYWCLECNPTPGYSFYDRVALGAISDAVIRELTG